MVSSTQLRWSVEIGAPLSTRMVAPGVPCASLVERMELKMKEIESNAKISDMEDIDEALATQWYRRRSQKKVESLVKDGNDVMNERRRFRGLMGLPYNEVHAILMRRLYKLTEGINENADQARLKMGWLVTEKPVRTESAYETAHVKRRCANIGSDRWRESAWL